MVGKNARDVSGTLICCGMAALIAFQSFINICVATGLMPNTGLPLPICKLRTDITDQSLHWDWHGSEYRTAGTKILKWRRYKGGLIYEYRTYCT